MAVAKARVSEKLLAELDARAESRGVTRSVLLRELMMSSDPTGGIASITEVLMLLSERARGGSVTAATVLLKHLTSEQPQRDEADPFDAAAERSLRIVSGDGSAT